MRHTRLLSLLSALAVLGGCSLINKFDDVKQTAATGGTGGSSGTSGTGGGAGIDGSAGTSGTGGAAGIDGGAGAAGTGATGGTGGSAGASGAAGAAGADSGPVPEGLIVMAAQLTSDPTKYELDVLDPWTGTRVATSEPIHVQAIAYDTLRSYWYIFEQGTTAADPATLHVRQFDRKTTTWTELGSATVPAPASQSILGVLNQRILYESTVKPAAGIPTEGLSILDTSDPKKVTVIGNPSQSAIPDGAKALIARPNSSAAGGACTLVTEPPTSCAPLDPDAGTGPTVCAIHVITATVTPTGTTPTFEVSGGKDVGQIPQSASGIGVTSEPNTDFLVLPPVDYQNDPTGYVLAINPTNHNTANTLPFTVHGPRISDAVYEPCNKFVIAGELVTDQSMFVIPTTAGGTTLTVPSQTPVQRLTYEPYTRTVLRLFDDPANPEINAFVVGGTTTAPTLDQRSSSTTLPWTPPAGLRPKVVVAKPQPSPVCN